MDFLKKNKQLYKLYEPGTDITAFLWKMIQHTSIQNQLDSTHDMYKLTTSTATTTTTTTTTTTATITTMRGTPLKITYSINQTSSNSVYSGLIDVNLKNISDISLLECLVQNILLECPLTPDIFCSYNCDPVFQRDIAIYENKSSVGINNLIDLRMPRVWIEYLMTDGVKRYGTCHNHPIFNNCPGWLIDAIHLQITNPNLSLVYSTDIRGVNTHLGQLCSLINLHHIFRRFENVTTNYSALLLQLTVLSNASINSINRRGNKFPANIISSSSFEDVKRQIMATERSNLLRDDMSSFVSRLTTSLPPPVGTNFFNLILKKS